MNINEIATLETAQVFDRQVNHFDFCLKLLGLSFEEHGPTYCTECVHELEMIFERILEDHHLQQAAGIRKMEED